MHSRVKAKCCRGAGECDVSMFSCQVSTGEEGYRADGPTNPPHNNWCALEFVFKSFVCPRHIKTAALAAVLWVL